MKAPAFLFLALSIVSPAIADPLASIAPSQASESVPEQLRTAGDLVVGAIFQGRELLPSIPIFRATIAAEDGNRPLCLRARSADGFYLAEYDYTVPADWSRTGVLEFLYPTRHQDLVSDPPGPTLAVAAYHGTCTESGGDIIVGFWNTPDDPRHDQVILALNTVGADAAHVFVGAALDAPAQPCTRITADRTTGFDFTCLLTLPAGAPDRLPIEIHVRHNSTYDPARTEYLRLLK